MDSDGEAISDYEEFRTPFRSPVIAELPRVELEVVGQVFVELNVEYSDGEEQSREFGTNFTRGETTTTGSTHSDAVNESFSAAVEIGTEAGFPPNASVKTSLTLTGSVGGEHIWGTSKETARMSETQKVDLETTATSHTETSSSGRMSTGIQLTKTGSISYRMTNFGITVQHWLPQFDPADPLTAGAFETLATLVPDLPEITLAPANRPRC